MNSNHRIDFEMVSIEHLTKMQAKLNQWLTKGELVSYKTSVISSEVIMFEYIRTKG